MYGMKLGAISRIVSWVIMTTSYLVLYLTFLVAYLSPNMAVLVTINDYGEANLELILLTLALPFIWYGGKDYLLGGARKA